MLFRSDSFAPFALQLDPVHLHLGDELAAFTTRLPVHLGTASSDSAHDNPLSILLMKLRTIIDILIEDNLSSGKNRFVKRQLCAGGHFYIMGADKEEAVE